MTTRHSRTLSTYTGVEFDFDRPVWDIREAAHVLSLQPRWGGRTRDHYSVAQHLVMVATLCPQPYKAWGLLHDLHESVILDLPRPVKALVPDYCALERSLVASVAKQFGLPVCAPMDVPEVVRDADDRMMLTEASQLFTTLPSWWEPEDWEKVYRMKLTPWSMADAEDEFLKMARDLGLITQKD